MEQIDFVRLAAFSKTQLPTNASFNLVLLSSIYKLAFNLATFLMLVMLMKHFIVAVVILS